MPILLLSLSLLLQIFSFASLIFRFFWCVYFFKCVYVIDKDACPGGPLLCVNRCFQVSLSSLLSCTRELGGGRGGEKPSPSCQTMSVSRNRGCPLDVILESPMCRRMFHRYGLSSFNSSEMLLVSLLQGREYLSRSIGCQSSLQCVYSPMYLLPKLSRESCPTHSVLHLLSWHLISSAGPNGLYLVPGLPHGWQEP